MKGALLIAVFLIGVATGRLAHFETQDEPRENYEIREGQMGYINPLLECEIANPGTAILRSQSVEFALGDRTAKSGVPAILPG